MAVIITTREDLAGVIFSAVDGLKTKTAGSVYGWITSRVGKTADEIKAYVTDPNKLSDAQFDLLKTTTGSATSIQKIMNSEPYKSAKPADTKTAKQKFADKLTEDIVKEKLKEYDTSAITDLLEEVKTKLSSLPDAAVDAAADDEAIWALIITAMGVTKSADTKTAKDKLKLKITNDAVKTEIERVYYTTGRETDIQTAINDNLATAISEIVDGLPDDTTETEASILPKIAKNVVSGLPDLKTKAEKEKEDAINNVVTAINDVDRSVIVAQLADYNITGKDDRQLTQAIAELAGTITDFAKAEEFLKSDKKTVDNDKIIAKLVDGLKAKLDKKPEVKAAEEKQAKIKGIQAWASEGNNVENFLKQVKSVVGPAGKRARFGKLIAKIKGITDDKLDEIDDKALGELYEAIRAYRVSSLDSRINGLDGVGLDSIVSDGEVDKLFTSGSPYETLSPEEQQNKRAQVLSIILNGAFEADEIGNSIIPVSSTIDDETLTDREKMDDTTLEQTIIVERRKAFVDIVYGDAGILTSDTPSGDDYYKEEDVVRVASQLERLESLTARADALGVAEDKKPKYVKPAASSGIEGALRTFEAAVSEAERLKGIKELKEKLGIGAEITQITYVDPTTKKEETVDIDGLTAAQLEIIKGQTPKPVEGKKKKGKTKEEITEVFGNERVAAYAKANAETIANDIAKLAGKDSEYAKLIVDYINKLTMDVDGSAVLDDALRNIATARVLDAWTKERLGVLKTKLGLADDAKVDGKELKDLDLKKIEEYISRVDKLYASLGAADKDKLAISIDNLTAVENAIKTGGKFEKRKGVLKILLEFGFSVAQAEKIIDDADLSELAGIKDGAGVNDIRNQLELNSGILKFKTSGSTDVVDFYINKATEEERKQESLKSEYKKALGTRTTEVDAVVGDRDKDELGADLKKLEKLDAKVIDERIKELRNKKPKTTEEQVELTKLEMLQEAIKYKELQEKAGKAGATAADKESASRAKSSTLAARRKYLLVQEVQSLAEKIKEARDGSEADEVDLTSYKTQDISGDKNEALREKIRKQLIKLKSAITDFEDQMAILKQTFGIDETEILLATEEGIYSEASDLVESLGEKVETPEEKIARESGFVGDAVFDVKVVQDEMKACAGKNSKVKAAMEAQVENLLKPNAKDADGNACGYKDFYDAKYGEGAFDQMVSGLKMNGGIDNNEELARDDDKYFKDYARAMAASISLLLRNIRTSPEKLSSDDCCLYAHIMVMVEAGSQKLFKALSEVLSSPEMAMLKNLVKGKKLDDGVMEDYLRKAEIAGFISGLKDTLKGYSDDIIKCICGVYKLTFERTGKKIEVDSDKVIEAAEKLKKYQETGKDEDYQAVLDYLKNELGLPITKVSIKAKV